MCSLNKQINMTRKMVEIAEPSGCYCLKSFLIFINLSIPIMKEALPKSSRNTN